jgi:uncharacterized protein involved in type VI secretion and phage assembly
MMDLQPLAEWLERPEATGRYPGVVVGIVTNNQDPDGLGRVKVRLPWLTDDDESPWARVASPMAGKQRGFYCLPEVDDEVLVAFEHGRIDHPYILGALWNGKDAPPESNSDGKNAHRSLTSRSGHVVRLDDTDGQESIVIVDKTGKNQITIKAADNSITIAADGDITIKSGQGKLSLSGMGIELNSQAGVKVQAQTDVALEATGQMNIKGQMVNIN